MSTITVNISPAGKVDIDAEGFQGTSCAEATEHLELVLGGGAAKKSTKPEYHAAPAVGTYNKLTF